MRLGGKYLRFALPWTCIRCLTRSSNEFNVLLLCTCVVFCFLLLLLLEAGLVAGGDGFLVIFKKNLFCAPPSLPKE